MTRTGYRIVVRFVVILSIAGCRQSSQPTSAEPQQGVSHEEEQGNRTSVRIERLKETETVLSRLGKQAWVFRLRGAPTNCELNVFHKPVGADSEVLLVRFSGDEIIDLQQSGATELSGKPASQDDYLIIAFPDIRPMQADDEFTFSFSQGVSNTRVAKCKDVFPDVFFDTTLNNASQHGDAGSAWTLQPGESAVLNEQTFWKTDQARKETGGKVRFVVTATCLKAGELPPPN